MGLNPFYVSFAKIRTHVNPCVCVSIERVSQRSHAVRVTLLQVFTSVLVCWKMLGICYIHIERFSAGTLYNVLHGLYVASGIYVSERESRKS